MNEVADADAVAIAIASGDHYVQIVIGQFDSFGNGYRAPVQAVNAIGMNESGQVR